MILALPEKSVLPFRGGKYYCTIVPIIGKAVLIKYNTYTSIWHVSHPLLPICAVHPASDRTLFRRDPNQKLQWNQTEYKKYRRDDNMLASRRWYYISVSVSLIGNIRVWNTMRCRNAFIITHICVHIYIYRVLHKGSAQYAVFTNRKNQYSYYV